MVASSIEIITPAPRDVWNSLIQIDDEALISQSPDWTDAVCSTGHYTDASRLYVFPYGQQIVLPLVRKTYFLFVSLAASMPSAWDVGGILSKHPPSSEELHFIFLDLAQLPDIQIMIRPNPLQNELWENAVLPNVSRIPRKSHVLSLEGGFKVVWEKRFSGGARNAVSKAERRGVRVECDTTGRHVDTFYHLFHKAVSRWAKIQHEPVVIAKARAYHRDPKRKFESLMRLGNDACKIWVAYVKDRPAAALIVIQKQNAQYIRGVMDETLAGPVKANYLLHRYAIEDACQNGCRRYHMGESGNSQSLGFFKTRFGAESYPYFEYFLERMPLNRVDRIARDFVKSVIGFKDVKEMAN
jgi:hypothetical protein